MEKNTVKTYKLKINYVNSENGKQIIDSFTGEYEYGSSYDVMSPTVAGYYSAKTRVKGVMPRRSVTVTVMYTKNTYKLTVNYRHMNGAKAAKPYNGDYQYGQEYNVSSPIIEGYKPSTAVVKGTMPSRNVTVSVIYTKIKHDEIIIN